MNKHMHLIKLIVITAGLIAAGVIAFNFVQKKGFGEVKIQSSGDPYNLRFG